MSDRQASRNRYDLFPLGNLERPTLDTAQQRLPDHLGRLKTQNLRSVIALYDTGASLNAIDTKFAYKHYANQIKRRKTPLHTDTANGRILIKEYVTDTILFRNRLVETHFYLIPNLGYNLILGRNTLRHMGYRFRYVDEEGERLKKLLTHHADLSHWELDNDDLFFNRIDYDINIEDLRNSKTTIGDCSPTLEGQVKQILKNYIDRLAKHEADCGHIDPRKFDIECTLPLKEGARPFKLSQPYNLHPLFEKEARRQIEVLLKAGWIRKSKSPWASGITFSRKKNGELRFCTDLRQLNLRLLDQTTLIPKIPDLLAKFKGKKCFTSLDLKSGYWNIEIAEDDREKTAFLTPWGHFEWCRMPFGIKTAPLIFQRAMEQVFKGLDFVLIYLDDIVILSDNEAEHADHLRQVFQRLKEYNMKVRLDKCQFAVKELEYLGHLVNSTSQSPTPTYKGKVVNCRVPKNKKELESFLGLCNWISRFVPVISDLTNRLYKATHKKKPFVWSDALQADFDRIKAVIDQIKSLRLPDFSKRFYVETDASIHSLGAVLLQQDERGLLQPVEWLSKSFDQTQLNWSIAEKECFAAIYAIEKWEKYLKPQRFTLYTDHANLALLFNFARIFKGNKLWRWALRLQEYSFDVVARPGSEHVISDYLSRYNDHLQSLSKEGEKDDSGSIDLKYEIHRIDHSTYYPSPFGEQSSIAKYIADNTDSDLVQIEGLEPPTRQIHYMYPVQTRSMRKEAAKRKLKWANPVSNRLSTRYPYCTMVDPNSKKFCTNAVITGTDELTGMPFRHCQKCYSKHRITRQANTKFPKSIVSGTTQSLTQPSKASEASRFKGFPISEIRIGQSNDPICYHIKQYVKTKLNKWLVNLPQIFKRVAKGNKHFSVKSDLLYFDERLYCPSQMRYRLINLVHSQYHHIRFDKMKAIMTRKYYWPSMLSDIDIALSVCDICSQCLGDKRVIRPTLNTFPSDKLFETIHVDLIGPFRTSRNGYRYAITMCDRFSRYLEIVPLKDMKAFTCAQAIVNKWVSSFGVPQYVISDQGTQFEGKLFESMFDILGIKRKRTTAYRPLSNGRLERMHREIKKHLRVIAASYNLNFSFKKSETQKVDNWDTYLDIIKFKLNATPSRMTGFAPIEMVLGYIPTMPEDTAWDIDTKTKALKSKDFKSYINWLRNVKKIIHSRARINQSKYDKARKNKYDTKATKIPLYKVGDLVRYYIYDANKLSPQWSEKYRITQFYDDYVVRLKNVRTNKYRTVNVDHIKLATHRHLPSLEKVKTPEETIQSQARDLARRHSPTVPIDTDIDMDMNSNPTVTDANSDPQNTLNLPQLNSINTNRKRRNRMVKNSRKRRKR